MDSCEDGSVHVPLQKNIQKREPALKLCLHGELNAGLNSVQVVKEFLRPVGQECSARVVDVSFPEPERDVCCCQSSLLYILHHQVGDRH